MGDSLALLLRVSKYRDKPTHLEGGRHAAGTCVAATRSLDCVAGQSPDWRDRQLFGDPGWPRTASAGARFHRARRADRRDLPCARYRSAAHPRSRLLFISGTHLAGSIRPPVTTPIHPDDVRKAWRLRFPFSPGREAAVVLLCEIRFRRIGPCRSIEHRGQSRGPGL